MQVEAGDNGSVIADQRADAMQQLPFAVVEMRGHHRAMQVEVDGIDRSGAAGRVDAVEDLGGDLFVGCLRDMRRWTSGAENRRDQDMASFARARDETRAGDIAAFDRSKDRVAARELRPAAAEFERPHVGLRWRERVGFVLKSGEDDTLLIRHRLGARSSLWPQRRSLAPSDQARGRSRVRRRSPRSEKQTPGAPGVIGAYQHQRAANERR